MRAFKIIILIIVTLITFYRCNNVDVPDVDVNVNFVRIDSILFSYPQDSVSKYFPDVVKKYPDFMEDYFRGVLKVGPTNDLTSYIKIEYFLKDMRNFGLDTAISNHFKNISSINKKITNAFKFFKYYYPKDTIPTVFYFDGGFNQSIITGHNYIGVGLDKYLGYKSPYYMSMYMQMPLYIQYYSQARFIPYDVMIGLFNIKFDFPEKAEYNLLNNIIYEGKKLYFISKMFPNTPDSTLMKYTTKQINWVRKNESNIWSWFIHNKKLFITDYKEIRGFIAYAPFTNEISQDSPGRIGCWTGWQIVKSYAENNKLSLQEVMAENDFDKILNESKYSP